MDPEHVFDHFSMDSMDPEHVFGHNLCEPTIMSPNFTKQGFEYNMRYISMSSSMESQNCLTLTDRNLTGSMAELFTDKPFATFGDLDVMWNLKDVLAFFENVSTSLIKKYNFCFNPRNTILKIIPDEKYPGYVIVVSSCRLVFEIQNIPTKDHTMKKFPLPDLDRKISMREQTLPIPESHNFLHGKIEKRGPAQKISFDFRSYLPGSKYEEFVIDTVSSVRCLTWPPGASEWKTRSRKHGWPDERTISLVVEGGCHIVPVAHDDCTENEFQWRISFSRAEVTLMRTLTLGQQYIYNMLRLFVKTELIPVEWSSSDRVVTLYMVKTLMLWQCERKPTTFWRMENTFELCCRFLKTLLKWLRNSNFENYFIRDCNLLSHKISEKNYNFVVKILSEYTNVDILKGWFVRKHAQLSAKSSVRSNTLPFAYCASTDPWPNLNEESIKFYLTDTYIKLLFLLKRIFQPGDGTLQDRGSTGMCANDIGCMDVFFVDYYKCFVMLQTGLLNRTYKKCDNLLAMLCTLYFNQNKCIEVTPSSCHSTIFQLIMCRFYYTVAKKVLMGHVTRIETDFVVMVKLAKMLIKKELNLSGVYPKESDKSGLHLHLASIYYASGRYDKFLKYIKTTPHGANKFSKSNELTWISGNCLLYIDDVAVAVGLQRLIDHGSTVGSRSCFQISLSFLRKYLFFSHRMKESKQMLSNSIISLCGPEATTDLILARCMQHRADRQCSVIEPPGDLRMTWFAWKENNYGIQISIDNKFSDLIFKCAIIHLTNFYRQFKDNEFVRRHRFMRTCWHYLALYWYSQKKYDVVLELCETIIREEEWSKPIFMHPHMVYMPSCFFPFQDLFDSDVNCLMGMMFLIDMGSFLCIRNRHTMWDAEGDLNINEICIHIRPQFIAQYLTVRCLIELRRSDEDLVSAICRMSSKLFMEHLLHQFIVFKVSKQRRNPTKV